MEDQDNLGGSHDHAYDSVLLMTDSFLCVIVMSQLTADNLHVPDFPCDTEEHCTIFLNNFVVSLGALSIYNGVREHILKKCILRTVLPPSQMVYFCTRYVHHQMRRQGFKIKSSMVQMAFWIKTTKMLSKESLKRLGLLLKTYCNRKGSLLSNMKTINRQ